MVVVMSDKFIIKKRQPNKTLRFFGVNAVKPLNCENRFFEKSIGVDCGNFCHECQQFKAGLCKGCYSGCSDTIRECDTIDCDVETVSKTVDKSGKVTISRGPCVIRCCKRYNLDEWIDDVSDGTGSLKLDIIKWQSFDFDDLPSFIPSLKGPVGGLYLPYVSIPLNLLYSLKTKKIIASDKSVYEMFDLHPNTKVILNSYCPDPIIESFWEHYRANDLLAQIYAKGVHYSLGFNYSFYFGQPRMEHLINLRRNFGIITDLQEAGFKVIPDLCWMTILDIERIAAWINKNNVTIVSMSVQLSRNNEFMARNLLDIEKLQLLCPNVQKWIVNGPSTAYRVRFVMQHCKNMVLMNKFAYQQASYRLSWDYNCNDYVKVFKPSGKSITRRESFEKMCQFFKDIVDGIGLDRFGKNYFK